MANANGANQPPENANEDVFFPVREGSFFKQIGEICGLYKTMVVVSPYTSIYLYGVEVGAILYLDDGETVLGRVGEIVRPLRFLVEMSTHREVTDLAVRTPVYMRKFLLARSQRNTAVFERERTLQCFYTKITNTFYGAYQVEYSDSTARQLKLREMYSEFLDVFHGHGIQGSSVKSTIAGEEPEDKYETKIHLIYPD
ncbi:uncharacterized protein [Onthophagus taurus]|uniref:uncharacterized protein n=1 Tax=Onthophagus taurus TaxID=166361 RepID=UPI000C2055D2|nr:uncharacterized protein LOC111414223 [Onthophagus taurus]